MIVDSARLAREHTKSELRAMYVSAVNQLRPDIRVRSDGTIVDSRPRVSGNYNRCRLKGFEGGGDYLMTGLRRKPDLTVEFWHDRGAKPPRKTYRQFLAERIANIVNGAAKSRVYLKLEQVPTPMPRQVEVPKQVEEPRTKNTAKASSSLQLKRLDAIEARLAAIEERLSAIDDSQGALQGDLDDIQKHMRRASSALRMAGEGHRATD